MSREYTLVQKITGRVEIHRGRSRCAKLVYQIEGTDILFYVEKPRGTRFNWNEMDYVAMVHTGSLGYPISRLTRIARVSGRSKKPRADVDISQPRLF